MTPERRPFVVGCAATEVLEPAETDRAHFAACRSRVCPGAIEPGFLASLRNLCNRGRFVPETVEDLTETPYCGGAFELRNARTGDVLTIYRHTQAGAMLVVNVARDLEHRVLPVTGGGPRRVYTGRFFRAQA